MTIHRWEGTATAVSSIVHGGDALGTITYLRREAFLTPQGRLNIPVLSGNGLRGILRDIGARLTWEALGEPDLPLPVLHALWSGGALVKAKSKPLTGQRLADLRRMVPHVGVFGAAGGGRILDSILDVGKMVPLCAETAHLIPAHLNTPGPYPPMHDLLQIERYSTLPGLEQPATTVTATPGTGDQDPADLADPSTSEGLMRYGAETFVVGSRFHTWFALRHPTAQELGFFTDVLTTYLAAPHIGGKSARGHGRLSLDLTASPDPTSPAPTAPTGNTASSDWTAFGGASVDDVITALGWLD